MPSWWKPDSLSKEITGVISNLLAGGKRKKYIKYLKQSAEFCPTLNLNKSQFCVRDNTGFLLKLYEKALDYSAINTTFSMLFAVPAPSKSVEFGKRTLVTGSLKYTFSGRSRSCKY